MDSHNLDSPWVKASPDNVHDFLSGMGMKKVWAAGSALYHQGALEMSLYYLQSGRVKVSIVGSDGLEKTLAIHEAPAVVGECAAFDQRPHFAACTALEDSVGRIIPVNDLLTVMSRNPSIARELGRSLAQKIRLLAYHVADLSFRDSMSRVGHLLLKMAEDFGVQGAAGKRLSISLTHQDIANLTGVSRVTVTNILSTLTNQGFIQKKRKEIVVTDEGGLLKYITGGNT